MLCLHMALPLTIEFFKPPCGCKVSEFSTSYSFHQPSCLMCLNACRLHHILTRDDAQLSFMPSSYSVVKWDTIVGGLFLWWVLPRVGAWGWGLSWRTSLQGEGMEVARVESAEGLTFTATTVSLSLMRRCTALHCTAEPPHRPAPRHTTVKTHRLGHRHTQALCFGSSKLKLRGFYYQVDLAYIVFQAFYSLHCAFRQHLFGINMYECMTSLFENRKAKEQVLQIKIDVKRRTSCSHRKTKAYGQAFIGVDDPHVEAHFPDDKQEDWFFPDQKHNIFLSPE
ncbi:hypothetical protein VNO78_20486 [Psophocarpus tetragonolobus]|uniref:Uncharacterized protein n=1 Tax=Psophocarpus tetragonolobus TaxID=3891 RepID=A0AAN9S9H6_PSOTE